MSEKVSIITASYNYDNLIPETIESVLNQTYQNWEMIIVDDGSKDNSVGVIKSYCEKDKRIKLYQHDKGVNRGLAETLKLGISKAQNDWIIFLESDDTIREDYIEKKLEIIKKYPDIKFIYNDVNLFGNEEKIKEYDEYFRAVSTDLEGVTFPANVSKFLFKKNIIPTFSCVMLKKEILNNVSFDSIIKPCLDWFLWSQITYKYNVYFINEKLTNWRIHRGSYIDFIPNDFYKYQYFVKCQIRDNLEGGKHKFANRLNFYYKRFKIFRKKLISVHINRKEISLEILNKQIFQIVKQKKICPLRNYISDNNQKSELHLIILWQNARYKQDKILEDIKKHLKIVECYDIAWSRKKVANNFTRFYGEKLDDGSFKEKECGKGRFLLVTVIDDSPKYEIVETSHGLENVNINLFNLKTKYREWTRGGHKIHATNSVQETNHDITLLLGINYDDYISKTSLNVNTKIKKIKRDLTGANGWNCFDELFYTLNATTDYVVLRGQDLIDNQNADLNNIDIDILTDDYKNISFIVNGSPQINEIRPHYYTKISDSFVYLDIWNINNDYYDSNWSKLMLKSRIKENNICILNNENAFFELIYHSLIHKNEIKNEYYSSAKELFYKNSFNEKYDINSYKYPFDLYYNMLSDFMKEKGYNFVKPKDNTVFYNEKVINLPNNIKYLEDKYKIFDIKPYLVNKYNGGGSGYVYYTGKLENGEKVFIKYDGFENSAENEFRTLETLNKINPYNFLKPYFFECDENHKYLITEFIEGMSFSDYIKTNELNDNIKKYLQEQFENIAKTLIDTEIIHRDLRPANIMITKDLRPVVIDTQFAVSFNPYEELDCVLKNKHLFRELGEEYAVSNYVWDDMYSLDKICKSFGSNSNFIINEIGKHKAEMNYPILNNNYDLIVSIGAACSCTEALRAKDLQFFSYPFDWVAGSNFINRVKTIKNNFENWFNIEDLKFRGTREHPMPCDIYLNTRTNILFNHDFPMFSPLEILYGEVKEKYDRRINRFLYQISNSKNVLFVYIERPDIKEDTSAEELKEGYELLKNRFPNVDINILYLSNARDVDYDNRRIIKFSDNIMKIEFDYDGYDKKNTHVVNFKPLLKVFENIVISGKFLNFSQRLLKRVKFIIQIKNHENFTRIILFNLIRFKIWK